MVDTLLYEAIKSDIRELVKNRYSQRIINFLKVVISDIQRDPKKDYSNDKVQKVLKTTLKNLKELEKYGKDVSKEIELIQNYMPEKMSEEEVRKELEKINTNNLKNKFQAIGILKKKFGDKIDPEMVKSILNE